MEQVRRHVWLLFFINGLLLASWAVEIPNVQAKLNLGDGLLGLLLFTMVVGNVAALPVVNAALPRVGVRVTATFSLLLMALSLAALPYMPDVWLTGLMLGLFGAGFSGVDLAMNTAGAWLEQRLERPLMSGLHGAFSVGALLGALLGSALLGQGVTRTTHLAIFGLLAALTASWVVRVIPTCDGKRPLRNFTLCQTGNFPFCSSCCVVFEHQAGLWTAQSSRHVTALR